MTKRIIMNQQKNLLFDVMVINDFQRADIWTKYADRSTQHENKTIARKIPGSDIETKHEDEDF